ncbi:MAG TPA: CDP-diacylglycerol--glycerol-3-phosphate 3-phosphatidyltransferase [Candidatus Dormibacteraeota bacterium]
MNLPNALTFSRLLAIPVLILLLSSSAPYHDQLAAGVFLVFSATDSLDGQLARRRGQVTELGKFLDPLADKLFVLAVLIELVQVGQLAAWVAVVVFGRELLITILRSVSAGQGHVISATPFGKTKTITQVGAILLLILQRPYPLLEPAARGGVVVMVVFTVASGLDYIWSFRHVLARGAGATALAAGGAPVPDPVDPLARRLGERLGVAGLKLALAESCTGGLVAALVTELPGSSAYFLGGVVAYSNGLKQSLLGVPGELLERYGAVSAEVARAMAEGARTRLAADLAASVTGIAGPEADGSDKPVGLTFIGVAGPDSVRVERFHFTGDRWENRRQAAREALRLLLATLDERTGVRYADAASDGGTL